MDDSVEASRKTRARIFDEALQTMVANLAKIDITEESEEYQAKKQIWEDLTDRGEDLIEQYNRKEDAATIKEAVECFRDAGDLSAEGVGSVEDSSYTFGRLAVALLSLFSEEGDVDNLTLASLNFHLALELTPPDHPNRSNCLNNLASAQMEFFKEDGDLEDLDAAIDNVRKAVELTSPENPLCAPRLNRLASFLLDRFENTGDRENLDQSIVHERAALELSPAGDPSRITSLSTLAQAILTRFEQFGNRSDLEEAIIYYKILVSLVPDHHPQYTSYFDNYASALATRFKHGGNSLDLDDAITVQLGALEMPNINHFDRFGILKHLASTLLARFKEIGDRTDLDMAIVHCHSALDLISQSYPERSDILNNLATALLARFEQVGERTDLDTAVSHLRNAVELTSPSHIHLFARLVNLASSLLTRFRETGDIVDLTDAIFNHRSALDRTPPGHPDRSNTLSGLSDALLISFENKGDLADLDEAIVKYISALELISGGHPLRGDILGRLANGLLLRFRELKNYADVENAINYHPQALDLRPIGHPDRAGSLFNLASALLVRLDETDVQNNHDLSLPFDVPEAQHRILGMLEQSTSDRTGSHPSARLQASLLWVDVALKWSDVSAVSAYRVSLEILDTLLSSGLSLESRLLRLMSLAGRRTQSLAVDGAACAIAAGLPDVALEMLEQGRTLLLTQAGKYRTPIEDVQAVDPTLAVEFKRLGPKMEASIMAGGHPDSMDESIQTTEDVIAKYQNVSDDWITVVAQIRSMEGFESFLKPTPYTTLQKAASEGPVIVLNVSEKRSDAVIVQGSGTPYLVPLPGATPTMILEMTRNINSRISDKEFKVILRNMWFIIVQPVVDTLQEVIKLKRGSRIWWCPTGAALHLPLHAAGDYSKQSKNVPSLYISSYTPTLLALVKARASTTTAASSSKSMLIVGQSQNPTLPSVGTEIAHIKATATGITVLDNIDATHDSVIDAMTKHSWIHIACHGHLDEVRPFQSNFSLYDGPLTLLDITRQNLPNAELAFLSSCHSAESSRDRPDEVLHLTAAVQFAGFKSVVGTLWAVDDRDGPVVAGSYYSSLFGSGEKSASESSAAALHRAVAELRRQKVSVTRWACFVHYGC